MNTQTRIIIGLVVALSLVVGVLIGRSFGRHEGSYRNGQQAVQGSHRMPDGTYMMDNGDMVSTMHDMNAMLEGKTGDAFDKEFLAQMIVHHQGAVEMAQKVLAVSKRPELITLAHSIIDAQTKEIGMMKNWQMTWFK